MDQPKVERMLRLMKLLTGNEMYTIEELADKLEMSPRTIYRYIDTFKAAGFAVTKLRTNLYRLEAMPDYAPEFEKLIHFSEEEAYLVNSLIDRLDPTNNLKVTLKHKLSAIYQRTSIADFVDKKSTAGNVQTLADAIRDKRQAILHDYESGQSQTVRDRFVEPFAFSTNYIDVWAYDLEDGRNKSFKISRINEAECTDKPWANEALHKMQGKDVFRMSGDVPHRVRLGMSIRAKNLLLEEYPLAGKDICRQGDTWILDTDIYNYAGICRFYIGLCKEMSIIDSPEFEQYVREYVQNIII